MTRKEWRRRKVACDYFRVHRRRKEMTVAKAWKETGVIEQVCAALGPLSSIKRARVVRCLRILL